MKKILILLSLFVAPTTLAADDPALLKACKAGSIEACNQVGDPDGLLKSCKGGDNTACKEGGELASLRTDANLHFPFVFHGCKTNRDARACEKLGEFYRHGIGTKQHYRLAYKYSAMACTAGVAKGCLRVGFLYKEGQGVRQSTPKAKDYYRKACDLGLEKHLRIVC